MIIRNNGATFLLVFGQGLWDNWGIIGSKLGGGWFFTNFCYLQCFPKERPAISQSTLKSSTSSLSLAHLQSIDIGRSLGEDCNWVTIYVPALGWSRIGQSLVKHWCWPIIVRRSIAICGLTRSPSVEQDWSVVGKTLMLANHCEKIEWQSVA